MIVLDIEVNGEISAFEAHRICVKVEESIRSEMDNVFDIMIHVEPEGFKHREEIYGVNPEDLNPGKT
jgi:divalent metal cation (Fe/Co/Zn/Cd) transporter